MADLAAARLAATGFPSDRASVAALAGALSLDPPGTLPGVAITALIDGGLEDPEGALRALIPPLIALDVPLYEVIARSSAEAWPILAELATAPLAPRLWQELLNHPPAHDAAVDAVRTSTRSGRLQPTAAEAASILGVLVAWGEHDALIEIVEVLQRPWPWAVAWWALAEAPGAEAAASDLFAWLADPTPTPADLPARIAEAMVHQGPRPGFPLGAFLRWAGHDHGVLERWGVPDAITARVLSDWVCAIDEDLDRAWRAARHLCEAGAHGPEVISLIDPHPPWSASLLSALARADPPIPWLEPVLLARIEAHLEHLAPAVEALQRLGPSACAAALEIGLSLAEAAPIHTIPLRDGLVRIVRGGVDTSALAALASTAGDPALEARVRRIEPTIGPGEQITPSAG